MGGCCGHLAHLHFQATSRKQPNYLLSPEQLRSLVLRVLVTILPRFLSPLPLAASLIGTGTHEASKLSDRTQCPSVWVTGSQGQHNKLTPLQGLSLGSWGRGGASVSSWSPACLRPGQAWVIGEGTLGEGGCGWQRKLDGWRRGWRLYLGISEDYSRRLLSRMSFCTSNLSCTPSAFLPCFGNN